MIIIGMCGGSGAGKGYVCELFHRYGIPSIDTDEVYHKIISAKSECLDELQNYFGNCIISIDGSLNRQRLSEIVFAENSVSKLAELNKITHKHILKQTDKILKNYACVEGKKAAIVDAPLLFESGYDKECDVKIAVIADVETRILRLIKRDSITPELAKKRIKSQKSNEFLIKYSDYVIINNKNQPDLNEQTDKIISCLNIGLMPADK